MSFEHIDYRYCICFRTSLPICKHLFKSICISIFICSFRVSWPNSILHWWNYYDFVYLLCDGEERCLYIALYSDIVLWRRNSIHGIYVSLVSNPFFFTNLPTPLFPSVFGFSLLRLVLWGRRYLFLVFLCSMHCVWVDVSSHLTTNKISLIIMFVANNFNYFLFLQTVFPSSLLF